jgi:hypothetical protein
MGPTEHETDEAVHFWDEHYAAVRSLGASGPTPCSSRSPVT